MKRYIFLLVALSTIGITIFFTLLPLNGNTQADISNLYFTSITPAGFTFAIWSVIYLSWIILGIILLKRKSKHQIPLAFPLAIGLTALWLVPWHYEYIGTSFVVMAYILGLLLHVFFKQKYFRSKQYTLELFLGWILVASIANFHSMLVAYGLYSFPVLFTALSIIFGTLFNIYLIRYKYALIPALVFLWALFGIIQGQDASVTQNTALSCMILIFGVILVQYASSFKKMLRMK